MQVSLRPIHNKVHDCQITIVILSVGSYWSNTKILKLRIYIFFVTVDGPSQRPTASVIEREQINKIK